MHRRREMQQGKARHLDTPTAMNNAGPEGETVAAARLCHIMAHLAVHLVPKSIPIFCTTTQHMSVCMHVCMCCAPGQSPGTAHPLCAAARPGALQHKHCWPMRSLEQKARLLQLRRCPRRGLALLVLDAADALAATRPWSSSTAPHHHRLRRWRGLACAASRPAASACQGVHRHAGVQNLIGCA